MKSGYSRSVAEGLWAAALVVGFALAFAGWRSGGVAVPVWLAFAQVLPVVLGAVALVHVESLALVVGAPRREWLMLVLLVPVGALLIGALLAGGDSVVRPAVRIAAFAVYRRRDPDPPVAVADVFYLGAAVVLAPLLVLVFVLVVRLIVRLLAPSLRALAGPSLKVHLGACLWVPLLVLAAVGAAPAPVPRAVTAVLASALSAALLGLLVRRGVVAETGAPAAPAIATGAAAFVLIGYLAGSWASLP